MSRVVRSYAALIRMGLAEAVAYRAQIVIGLFLALVPLMLMAVWLTLVDQVGPAAGWQRADFIAYYVGAAVVYHFTVSYAVWEWQHEIRNGDLSSRLLKPLDPFHFFFSRSLGNKAFDVLLLTPVVVLAAFLVPELRFPLTPARFVVFAISLLSAFMLTTLMNTTFGMIAFWSTQSANLYLLWFGVGQFLSGWIAPLALFPDWFSQVAYLLPFHSTLGFPVEILIGRADDAAMVSGLMISLFWNIAFALLYRLLWRRGIARYEAVGS
ncbi:MAG: ABC-2 family transporter protein [Chloroflexia bacterium]